MDLKARIERQFRDSAELAHTLADELGAPVALAAEGMVQCLLGEGKILACGNGGSAAAAQHFASALLDRFEMERPGLAAVALTTDGAALTAIAGAHAFAQVFARQVNALGHGGDVLLVVAAEGDADNLLAAIEAAHERDMSVVALTGGDGGRIAAALGPGDVLLNVATHGAARIQEMHLLILHGLCDGIDCTLLGVED
jgi:D-sedoheptulose 7-phosphate isomerase